MQAMKTGLPWVARLRQVQVRRGWCLSLRDRTERRILMDLRNPAGPRAPIAPTYPDARGARVRANGQAPPPAFPCLTDGILRGARACEGVWGDVAGAGFVPVSRSLAVIERQGGRYRSRRWGRRPTRLGGPGWPRGAGCGTALKDGVCAAAASLTPASASACAPRPCRWRIRS